MATLVENIRKLNWLFQETTSGILSYNDLARTLGEMTASNVYLLNTKGQILGLFFENRSECAVGIYKDAQSGEEMFLDEYNQALLDVEETEANLTEDAARKLFKYDRATSGKMHTVIPIVNDGKRYGTLLLARYLPAYSDEDLALAECGATAVGMEICRREYIAQREEEQTRVMVRLAFDSLSYSEREAVKCVFKELPSGEGLLVASRIADQSGITRSVIVNALRKLESGSVIETRSLGMKGTYIRILNRYFEEELEKLV